MRKIWVNTNKPIHAEFSVLALHKIQMYNLGYKHVKKYNKKAKLCILIDIA